MGNLSMVKQLWADFQKLPFPHDIKSRSEAYVDMGRLNTTARQCIQQYVEKNGEIDIATRQLLKNCLDDMSTRNHGLTGDAQVYFGVLYRICDLIAGQDASA